MTGRSEEKRAAALALGADQAFESGARLPERVDGVMETVGEATWSHSIKSLKPGGVRRHLAARRPASTPAPSSTGSSSPSCR